MLGVLLSAVWGCAAQPPAHQRDVPVSFSPQASRTAPTRSEARPDPAPVVAPQPDDSALRAAVEEELGPEVVEELPPIKREPPKPRDEGANVLVNQMLAGIRDRKRDEAGVMRVCISKMRNLSRASASEFEQFLERFADVLSRSGRDDGIAFITKRSDEVVHYDMLGTAYLITADGFDVWELFVTITPAEQGWTVWQPAGPVRVLRQARPNQQQVFPSR